MRPKRQGIIIWYRHQRNLKQIRRYGHLIYASKKMRYALLYVDQENIKHVESKLKKQRFVLNLERSLKPFISTEFDKKDIAKPKEYDYHIGI